MAPRYGSKIVKDGLVLALDAANAKCSLRYVEVLVVAGGGGGGAWHGGGGGGGGLIYNSAFSITPGSAITTTVGSGGSGGTYSPAANGGNGSNSVFGSLTAIGGGGGGTYSNDGSNGGSGGGPTNWSISRVGGTGTSGQGFNGGSNNGQTNNGGGGGGAGGTAKGLSNNSGGDGLSFNISGSSVYYAGGGGAGIYPGYTNDTSYGYGGLGGGGNGGNGPHNSGTAPTAGVANTGGGGGGVADLNQNGAAGGSGIVIVRYPGSQRASGGTVTFINGYTIHTFTTSGTFTPNGAPGTGTIWTDISQNGNSGALVNSTGYDSANRGSFVFDGIDDRVDISNNSTLQVNNFTLEAWVYPINNSPNGHIIRKEGSYILSHYWGEGGGAAKFGIWMQRDGGWESIHANIMVPLNQWLYISGTYDNSSVIIYYNGNQVASTAKSGQTRVNTNPVFINGVISNSLTQNYKCSLVKIYNRALSATEIKQNFNALRGRYGL